MKTNLELYLAYLRNPVYLKNEKIQWHNFFGLYVWVFFLSILFNIIPVILSHLLHLQGLSHYLRGISRLKMWEVIFLIPVLEEVIFRLLLKPTRLNMIWYVVIISIPLAINLIRGKYYHALFFVTFLVIPLVLLLKKGFLKWAQKYFLKHFTLFFYLSCLIFGLVHITNFSPFGYVVLLLAPLLTLPQLFAGTILGFVRMKYGVCYSILFHFLINFPALLLLGK